MLTNNANTIVIPFAASDSEVSVMEMFSELGLGNVLNLKIENMDDKDIEAKLQESDDGSSWSDVTGTDKIIVPRGTVALAASVGKHFRLRVSGGYGRAVLSADMPVDHAKAI